MFNPNASKSVSEYDRVENTLLELTPDPRDFGGRTYPASDVESDIELLKSYQHTPEFSKGEERSDAKLLEKTFTDMAERGDWFGEEDAYGDDPDFLALVTFPTSEIDDTFNHIDVIGMISNETTGHETLPFAIDLTYNTDNDKMTKKFSWKHVYGKGADVPDQISEFGESYLQENQTGEDTVRTRSLPLKFRQGLKIPGFASAKYFEDKNNPWDPMYEKGRIDVMPRFIVGYSPEIADILSMGKPTDEYRQQYGEAAFEKKRQTYRTAEKRAKWCTLVECSQQASDIRQMIENLDDETVQTLPTEDLNKARKQIVAMDNYFSRALQGASKQIESNPDEAAAKEYTKSDAVCQAILQHSYNTYNR